MWHELESLPSAAIAVDRGRFYSEGIIRACRLNDGEFEINPLGDHQPKDLNVFALQLLGMGNPAIVELALQDIEITIETNIRQVPQDAERITRAIDPACTGQLAVARSIYPALGIGAINITQYSSKSPSPLALRERRVLQAAPLAPSSGELANRLGGTNDSVRTQMGYVATKLNTHGRAATIMMAYLHGKKYDLPDPADYKRPGSGSRQ